MNPFTKQVYTNMIEANAAQAMELIGADHYDAACHHFQEAIKQTIELKDLASNEPPAPEQKILDV